MTYTTPYIFIICAGRSGSTLLQNMLNADPNVLIRGENNNFFFHAFKANESLIEFDRGGDNPTKPWFGFRHFKANKYRKSIREIGIQFLRGDKEPSSIFKGLKHFYFLGTKSVDSFHLISLQKPSDTSNVVSSTRISSNTSSKSFIFKLSSLFLKDLIA